MCPKRSNSLLIGTRDYLGYYFLSQLLCNRAKNFDMLELALGRLVICQPIVAVS
jgi:hypothetical protein